MADDTLEWDLQFNLTGNGLAAGTAGLTQFQGALQKGQKAMLDFEQDGQKIRATFETIGDGASKAGKHLDGFAIAAGAAVIAAGVAAAAIGILVKGFKELDAFGDKSIQAFGERNASLRAYTALLHSSADAQREFGKAQALSFKLPFLSSDIEAAQKQLIVAGNRNEAGKAGGTLDRNLLTIADYASLSADKGQALQTGSHAVSEVYGKGYLSERQMQQLNQDLGVSIPILKENIRAILHLGKDADIDKLISKKGVSADVFGAAFGATKQQQLGGKALGDVATSGAGDLQTLLINQKEQVKNLQKTYDSDLLPGVVRYKAALQEQGSQFDVTTAAGKRMSLVLQDFANSSADLKSKWTEFTTSFYDSFTSSYMAAMNEMGAGAVAGKDSAASLRDLATQIGKFGAVVARVLHGITPLIEKAAFVLGARSEEDLAWDKQKAASDAARKEGEEKGPLAREMYDYVQEHPSLKKYPNLINEALNAPGDSAVEKIANALDKISPPKPAASSRAAAFRVPSGGGVGGKDEGWAVPWARSERFAAPWEAPGGARFDLPMGSGQAAPARFGADLAETARMDRAAAQDDQRDEKMPAPIINITINGANKTDKELAAMIKDVTTEAVTDVIDEKLRTGIGRAARGTSPKRL